MKKETMGHVNTLRSVPGHVEPYSILFLNLACVVYQCLYNLCTYIPLILEIKKKTV